MTNQEYAELAAKTDLSSEQYNNVVTRIKDSSTSVFDYLQDFIDVAQDLDTLKKHLYYGKDTGITENSGNTDVIEMEVADDAIVRKFAKTLHAIIGLATEAGELMEVVVHELYGKVPSEFDRVHFEEEIGDIEWYRALLYAGTDQLFTNNDTTQRISLIRPETAQKKNIAKLKARYGDKFSEEAALNRDLDKERATLED